jgi:phosphohistidine phosphatase
MEIYLLRHGIAEDGRPGRPDSERALTDEGREKLRRVMKRARAAGAAPTLMLSSPYLPALETAAIAAEVLGHKDEIEQSAALTPDGRPEAVWALLRERKDEKSILLASHEPLMSSTVALLLGVPALQVDMKKAALVRLDCDRFAPQPACVLKWMLTPAVAD